MSHISAETNALYLASKSNYQNIIDGTHLPGVSYPEALAENLSSKRTSHKIAEQGRRNRINLALKEIEGLLPASIAAAVSKREKNTSAEDDENGEKGQASIVRWKWPSSTSEACRQSSKRRRISWKARKRNWLKEAAALAANIRIDLID